MKYILRWQTTRKDKLDEFGESYIIGEDKWMTTRAWNRQREFNSTKEALKFVQRDNSASQYYLYNEFMRHVETFYKSKQGITCTWKTLPQSDREELTEKNFPSRLLSRD